MKTIMVVAFLAFLAAPLAVLAEDYYDYYTEDYDYRENESNPATKFAYGVTEVGLSWTEIPRSVYHYSKKYDPVSGFFLGIAEGTVLGVRDCAEGVVDTTTFLFPPYKTRGQTFFQSLSDWDKKVQERLW
jgi:putative exosortase-associated protein (TIGR04073 family)